MRTQKPIKHEYLGEPVGDGSNVFENVTLREMTDAEIETFRPQILRSRLGMVS